jgi:hypothetical protein
MWAGEIRKNYPLLTNFHENEMFEYLYSDKFGKTVTRESFLERVQREANRLDFEAEKPLNLMKEGERGLEARADSKEAMKRLREIEADIRANNERVRSKNVSYQIKQQLQTENLRLMDEKLKIENGLKTVIKTQTSFL